MPGFDLLNANEDAPTRRGLDLAPPATSSGIIDDSAREVARGESLRKNAGETVTVPKADWAKAVRIAGLALRDVGSSLQGRPTNFLLDAMMQEEQAGIRQQESGRAERRLSLEEQRGKREEELFPLQKQAAELQLTSAQLGNLESAVKTFRGLSRYMVSGTPEQKSAALAGAQRTWKGLGLSAILGDEWVAPIMNREDIVESLTLDAPYFKSLSPSYLKRLQQLEPDTPAALTELQSLVRAATMPFAKVDAAETARAAIEALKADGKAGPFGPSDLALAFAQKPLARQLLDAEDVAAWVGPDYVPGKVGLKVTEERALGPEKTAQKVAEAKALVPVEGDKAAARTAGELRAKTTAGLPLAGTGTVEERIAALRAQGPAGEKRADAIRKEIDATIAKKDTLKDVDLRGAVLGQARQLVAADLRSKAMTAEQRERVVQETARSIAEKDYQRADLFPKLAPLSAADQAKREQRIPVDVARQAMKDAGGNKEEAKKLLRQRGFDPKWTVR